MSGRRTGPAGTGHGSTRFRGDPSAAELDADPIASTARRGFGGELGQLRDLPPEVAAHALIGAHRALLDHVRSRVQADDNLAGLAAEVGKLADGALELLEQGLRAYAAAPPPLPTRQANLTARHLGSSTGRDCAPAGARGSVRSELDAVGCFQILDPVVLDGDPVAFR
jgi:hypothetical protein